MNRLCVALFSSSLILMGWGFESASADSLTDDDAAIAAHIKALHDVNSKARATAADALRRLVAKNPSGTIYLRSKDGGEAAWREKVNHVKPGMTKAEVLKILPRFPQVPGEALLGSGDSHVVQYRLDYHWTVRIYYYNPDEVIERPTLIKDALQVHVMPPKNFTGAWTTWYVNGQKAHEAQYQNGKYHGVTTSHHDNGAKSTEQRYSNHEAHGAGTGWYSNGKTSYTLQYSNGKSDGKWTHWYASGKKQSETDYNNGVNDGLDVRWHENGQISHVTTYRNGVRHGLEASWDKNGELDYKREYNNGDIVER